VKNLLVSQPRPSTEKNPYAELALKYSVSIDFRTFIEIEGVSSKEFRKSKIEISNYNSVIFTSKTAIDHYFRICTELRFVVPDTMKYFCSTEAVALYLQKYIVYRKRKIFFSNNGFEDLLDLMKKHSGDQFLLPVSDNCKKEILKTLDKAKINYEKAVFYITKSSDLNDIEISKYDLLVFFAPAEIKSLYDNFKSYKQDSTLIATFGPSTAKAAKDAGLNPAIIAPSAELPSMPMALDSYLKKHVKQA